MTTRGGWLAAPALLATGVLVLLPLLVTLGLAAWRYDALNPPVWVGADHLHALMDDRLFRTALVNSLLLIAVAVPVRLLVALGLGLLLAPRDGLSRGVLVPVFLPVIVPALVWAMAWLWVLNPHFGPAAWIAESVQRGGAQWLLSATGARTALVLVVSFLIGELVLVIIATRRQIPAQRYEICAVEGASNWFATTRVTLPAMWPVLLLLAARDVAVVLQLALVPSMIVTKGGPQFATFLLPQYVYQNAFEYLRFGYAAAMSSVMIAGIAVVLVIQFWLLSRWLRRTAN